jgi:hypothetical protein
MSERLGNLGYFGYIPEVSKGVALTPNLYTPIYDETMTTNANFQSQQPIYGGKFATYATLQGQREHQGDVTILGEPNVSSHIANMLLTKGTTSGTTIYTHPFTLSSSANPKSYTVDISTGNVVKRFWGVEASSLSPDYDNNEMRHKVKLSALGSFQARTIATVATITLTLKTNYDPAPNKGLVVGDLVRVYKAATGAILDTTIATVNVDGITVTLADSAASFAAGDIIHLRPATPSFTLLPVFTWAKTQFCFGATAAAALSAAHTPVEDGSTYEVMHSFGKDGGTKRSGSYDPVVLIRTTGDGTISIKKFFDTPESLKAWNDMDKSALVIRHFSGDTNQYEHRVTYNNITTDTPMVNISAGNVNYATLTYKPNYDTSDAAGMGITVINGLAMA